MNTKFETLPDGKVAMFMTTSDTSFDEFIKSREMVRHIHSLGLVIHNDPITDAYWVEFADDQEAVEFKLTYL